MPRLLTGIQNTGSPHLGNLLGAILPAIQQSQTTTHEAFFFIADLHTLTTIKDPLQRKKNSYAIAAAWLACGLDPTRVVFYRQSQVPAVCELAWYLNCLTPYPMLTNAHAFKDKANRLADVNAGLFTYPVLMAADILLYQADIVPVGQDQRQHIEITRDIAARFNHQYGTTLTLPQAQIKPKLGVIPGTDGQKMSKSYQNTIDPFLPEKKLEKAIMAIVTDSTALQQPKDPDQCTVFKLYSLIASEAQITTLRNQYQTGGYGYGQAKKALYKCLLERFATERQHFQAYIQDVAALEQQLSIGEAKAQAVAAQTLKKVRCKLGYA